MAFVARRNTEGKLVECQVISGNGTSSALQLSDQSDDDNDLGSMDNGYSNRSFISPTVRYVSSKEQLQEEDSEPDNCYSYEGSECTELTELGDLDSPNSTDSPSTYSDDYDGAGTDEPDDEQISGEAEVDSDISNQIPVDNNAVVSEDENPNNFDTMSMESFDVDTISSPRDEVRLLEADTRSIGSYDVSTVCRQSILEDLESVSSIDVATVCQPKQIEDNTSMISTDVSTICKSKSGHSKVSTFDDTISLGSCNSVSIVRPKKKKQGIALDSISTSTFECQSQGTNRTYNVHSNTVRRDDCSSASTCSWTDMYGGALQPSDSRSNIVPSLSLNLSNTSSSGSTTYFRNCDDKKERQGQAAYQEWVKRKERQKQEKKQAAIEERQKRDAETAMRQRLAKERYQEWIRQKELQQKKVTSNSAKSSSNSSASFQSNSSIHVINNNNNNNNNSNNSHKRPANKETSEAEKKRREQWERMKKIQEQRERERLRLLRITQQKVEEQRKEKSDGAWKNWMKSVGKRAKPVPLNQGFDTLRGTIANIYINPNQWVSNIDTNDSRGN